MDAETVAKWQQLGQLWTELTGDDAVPMSSAQRQSTEDHMLKHGWAKKCETCGSLVGSVPQEYELANR